MIELPRASLGSVLERDAAAEAGPRGRITVDVLEAWLAAGTVLDIVVPSRLSCAHCEGGGCDACGRSGALRVQGSDEERRLRITLSASARGLRLVRPLGPAAGLDVLIVELRPAAIPSALCRPVDDERRRSSGVLAVLVAVVLVVALILAFAVRR